MKCTTAVTAFLVLAIAGNAQAQEKASANKATSGITQLYTMVKANLLKTAEQVPEEKYSYQPTKEVRTTGQLLGHVADAQNYFCAVIAGTPAPYAGAAEKLEGKEAISAALKKSFDTCDSALATVTDADLTKTVKVFDNDVPLSQAITFLTAHNWEHYGNLVTYMRANGMVPPSSQRN
jgi:uncharacterized damage-inducible protein DinB